MRTTAATATAATAIEAAMAGPSHRFFFGCVTLGIRREGGAESNAGNGDAGKMKTGFRHEGQGMTWLCGNRTPSMSVPHGQATEYRVFEETGAAMMPL